MLKCMECGRHNVEETEFTALFHEHICKECDESGWATKHFRKAVKTGEATTAEYELLNEYHGFYVQATDTNKFDIHEWNEEYPHKGRLLASDITLID